MVQTRMEVVMVSNASLRRVTVTDEVQGVIRGYIGIWGMPIDGDMHRDSYGTYFDREQPPEMGLDFLPIPLIYEHGFDGGVKKEIIGRVVRAWFDDTGIAFEATLDKTGQAFNRFIDEIRSGKLATSSATSEHLAEFDGDGRFVRWILSELSLTASPAEELMPAVQLMRSNPAHDAPGQSQGEMTGNERNNTRQGHNQMLEAIIAALTALGPDATNEQIIAVLTEAGLSAEDFAGIEAQLALPQEERAEGEDGSADGGGGDTPATAQVASAAVEIIDALKVVLADVDATEAVAELEEARSRSRKLVRENANLSVQLAAQRRKESEVANVPNKPRHSNGGGGITGMEEVAYAGLNARQMGYGYKLLKTSNQPVSENYVRHMAGKALELVEKGPSSFRHIESYKSIRSSLGNATRADELVYTTNTGSGAEWIPAMWETSAWDKVRQELVFDVLTRNMMVVQADSRPGSTVTIPLVDSDPAFYKAAENKSVGADLQPPPLVDSSLLGTASVDVTPAKGMARVIVTQEMIEDSIVPVLPQLDQQFTAAFAEQMESLIINGDDETAANTNINLIDGTPAGGTSAPAYLISDGLLKYALVTGTTTYKADGGVLTTKDFLKARSLLPNNLVSDPSKLVFLSDNDTMLKMLDETDVKDLSVFRDPTIENGVLMNLWGTPYLQSGQMALANTAGKISATAGNNTKGRIVCLMPQYWAMVWKRQIRFATEPDIDTDTTKVVASFRVGFKNRSAGAATCIYNLTVAL